MLAEPGGLPRSVLLAVLVGHASTAAPLLVLLDSVPELPDAVGSPPIPAALAVPGSPRRSVLAGLVVAPLLFLDVGVCIETGNARHFNTANRSTNERASATFSSEYTKIRALAKPQFK